MAKLTLVGIKRFKSKKGNEVCVLSIMRPYTVEENDRGSYGSEIRTEFAPQEQINSFKADDIGKEVEFKYDFNAYGRPTVSEIIIKK